MLFRRAGEEKLVLFEIRWLLKGLQMTQLLSFSGGFVSSYALITLPLAVVSLQISSSFPRKSRKKLLRFQYPFPPLAAELRSGARSLCPARLLGVNGDLGEVNVNVHPKS